MSDIYVFSPDDDNNDYDSMGLVGALLPTECIFEETGNGESILTMTHPLDEYGRYAALVRGNILVVPVPVRTTPEIQNGSCVSVVWKYKIKSTITAKAQRTLYKKASGKKKKKVMYVGDELTVVYKPNGDGRWKAKTKYGTGWVNADPDGLALELITEYTGLPNNANTIQEIQSPWTVTDQYFRIYETKKGLDSINVSARHISYDLLYNVTSYDSGNETTLQSALDGVLNNCYSSHDFSAKTNISNTQVGLYYNGKNPIEAFLDPEEGICAKYKVDMIRDNFELFFLDDPGLNRGIRIQYGKNMTGIDFTESDDEVVTRIVPVGENKNGDPLYLDSDPTKRYIDISDYAEANPEKAETIPSYPFSHVYYLECDNCKVGDNDGNGGKITEAIAKQRMREQANKLFDEECYNPKVQMSVEFLNLGDTEEYAQFKNLENCFLFDYIIVQHPRLMVDVTAQIVKIKWNCLKDRMEGVEIGSVGETIANMGITTWQIPAGFSGSKIAFGTVSSKALGKEIINVDHIQANTINVSKLNADEITAYTLKVVQANIDSLTAGKITTDELYAEMAQITSAIITNADIANANIDHLSTKLAEIAQAVIDTADIREATIESAEIQTLVATLANIVRLNAQDASIENAKIDWASIEHLTAQSEIVGSSTVGTAAVSKATIDWAAIKNLAVAMGHINEAVIGHGTIAQADIDVLNAGIENVISIKAQRGDFEFATVQRLIANAMIIDKAVADTVIIKNLRATSAMFVEAIMDALAIKGDDGYYYDLSVNSEGTLYATNLGYTDSQIVDGKTPDGKPVLDATNHSEFGSISDLDGVLISDNELVVSKIFAKALDAEYISATQAFIASAILPELYVTAITALGSSLTITGGQISIVADGATRTLDEYVGDNAEDISDLDGKINDIQTKADGALASIEGLVVGGVNLIDNSETITIVGTDNPDESYCELVSDLEPGTAYTLSMMSAIQKQGNEPGIQLELLANGTTTSGPADMVVVNDSSRIPLERVEAYIFPIQDLHGYDKPWKAGEGKNLIPLSVSGIKSLNTTGTWSGNDYTIYGITYSLLTTNTGSVIGISVNGTANSDSYLELPHLELEKDSDYYYSGCFGGDPFYYFMDLGFSNTTWWTINIDGDTYFDIDEDDVEITPRISIMSGCVADDLLFLPMIRDTNMPSGFEPYENIASLTAVNHTDTTIYRTGKNLLPITMVSESIANLTLTVNSDGTISADGYHSNSSDTSRVIGIITLPKGNYTLSGGSQDDDFYLQVILPNSDPMNEDEGKVSFTLMDTTLVTISMFIKGNKFADDLTFSPMVSVNPDETFEKYNGESRFVNFPHANAGKNLFGPNDFPTIGKYLNSDGTVVDSDSWCYSDFISIDYGYDYYFNPNSSSLNNAKTIFYGTISSTSILGKGYTLSPINGSVISSSTAVTSNFFSIDFTQTPKVTIIDLDDELKGFVAAYNFSRQFLGRTEISTVNEYTLTSSSFTEGQSQGSGSIAYLRLTLYEDDSLTGSVEDVKGKEPRMYEVLGYANSGPIHFYDSISSRNISYVRFSYQKSSYNIQLEKGSSATSYEPYGMPIVAGKITIDTKGITKLVTYPYYSSYNGETLNGYWISNMEEYEEGTTPTIGAEVVDMSGAINRTYSLGKKALSIVERENYLWNDAGQSALIYTPELVYDELLDFSGGFQKFHIATPNDEHTYAIRIYAGRKMHSNGVIVELSKVKLELGGVATMWTESYSDAQARLISLSNALNVTNIGLEDIVTHVIEHVDGTVENVNSYFRFDGSNPNEPKLLIGSSRSSMVMELSNSRLSFLCDGNPNPVAYFSDNKLYVTNVVALSRLSVGKDSTGYLDIVTTDTGVGFVWRTGT